VRFSGGGIGNSVGILQAIANIRAGEVTSLLQTGTTTPLPIHPSTHPPIHPHTHPLSYSATPLAVA